MQLAFQIQHASGPLAFPGKPEFFVTATKQSLQSQLFVSLQEPWPCCCLLLALAAFIPL